MFWILFILLLSVFSFLGTDDRPGSSPKISSFFRVCLVVLLSYVISFGAQFSTDHVHYLDDYMSSNGMDFSEVGFSLVRRYMYDQQGYEVGYMLLSILAHKLHIGFPGFMFLIMLFVNYVYVDFAFKHKMPAMSILFFVVSSTYFQEANLVRQSIAIAIFIYSLRYVEKDKYLKCALCCFVAMLFHISSIILIPVYLLLAFRDRFTVRLIKYVLVPLWLLSIIVSLFHISIPMDFLGFINDTSFSSYSSYADTDNAIGMKNSFDVLYNVVTLFVFLTIRDNTKNLYTILIFGAVILNISTSIPNLGRVAIYFTSIMPLMYTTITLSNKEKHLSQIGTLLFVLLVLNFVRLLITVHIFDDHGLGTIMYPISAFIE